MFRTLNRTSPAALATEIAYASAAIARLDQALVNHPLGHAFLYRVRLDAVRRQAAVDGRVIDPWHLAAMIEGLRLRVDLALSTAERGHIFEAGRHAFSLYQWLTAPDKRLRERAPIEVLPDVAARVQAPLLLDSGVRRGADAVKALALGAQAVLLGRAVLYGLAARGEEGASHVLEILATELDTTLALVGCPDAACLGPGYVTALSRDYINASTSNP